jgi:hypothetical protein
MPVPKLFFKLAERSHAPRYDVSYAPLDSLESFEFLDVIEELLVGHGVLDHHLGFPIDGQHHRPPTLAHLFEKVGRVAFEVAEGVDVFADIEH